MFGKLLINQARPDCTPFGLRNTVIGGEDVAFLLASPLEIAEGRWAS